MQSSPSPPPPPPPTPPHTHTPSLVRPLQDPPHVPMYRGEEGEEGFREPGQDIPSGLQRDRQ